jgi:hypothetical protein
MRRRGQGQVVGVDAVAVVDYPDQLRPPLLRLQFDAARRGIDAVLQQLLDHRGGPLDHLAGGDLIGQLGG